MPGTVPNQAETLARRARHAALLRAGDAVGRRRRGAGDPVAPSDRRRGACTSCRTRCRPSGACCSGVTVETPAGARRRLHHAPQLSAHRRRQARGSDRRRRRAHRRRAASELPKILCGDFNATPDSDEIRFLRGLHTSAGRRTFWQDAWERRHGRADGFTWARANPYTARLRWLERDRRLDYIFVSPMKRDGRGVVHDCRIVLDRAGRRRRAAVGPLRALRRGAARRRSKRSRNRDQEGTPSPTADAHLLTSPVEAPAFTTTDPWRVLRIQGEFVRGFDALADVGPAVTHLRLGAHARRDRPSTRRRAATARLLGERRLHRSSPAAGRGSWRPPTAARARRARRRWG